MPKVKMFFMGGNDARRPRGRPPAQQPGSSLSTWVPVSLHDRLIEVASQREMSISALVREALVITVGTSGTSGASAFKKEKKAG